MNSEDEILIKKSLTGIKLIQNGKQIELKNFIEIYKTLLIDCKKLKEENVKLKNEISKLNLNKKPSLDTINISLNENDNQDEIDDDNFEKRIAISAEPLKDEESSETLKEVYQKTEKQFEIIFQSFRNNDLLCRIDSKQIHQICEKMIPIYFPQETFVIKENEDGDGLFVIEEGVVNVIKEHKILNKNPISSGTLFGELALLYNCKRTASIYAVTNLKLWFLRRKDFQMIMKINSKKTRDDVCKFMKSLEIFEKMNDSNIMKIVDAVEETFYQKESWIIKEKEAGETFFIIIFGEVKVYKFDEKENQNKIIRTLSVGDYFGEKALLTENCIRTASILASTDVRCYTIDRDAFNRLVGSVAEKEYQEKQQNLQESSENKPKHETIFEKIEFERIKFLITLGKGGFGQVDLVYIDNDTSKFYALKTMSKKFIVETLQQQHVLSEKEILAKIDCSFIVKLYQTYRDKRCVYLLLEPLLGGEIFSMMHRVGRFEKNVARFFIACVVEAFDYLHSSRIIYRDLKPENMVLNSSGYVKLVDFGFAKILNAGEKTWTFCGTPEYVSPEIITSKGHDRATDYWSLGILVFELHHGEAPFKPDNDSLSTYRKILSGIDAVKIPRTIHKQAQDLIKKLLKENPTARLGYQKNGVKDIKKHKFFEGFDWKALSEQTMISPAIPKQTTLESIRANKRNKLCPLPVYEIEESGWDKDF